MGYQQLSDFIFKQQSFLCVGLDTDVQLLPSCVGTDLDAVFTFNKAIIDATAQYCIAFKPNTAFYEVYGAHGWELLAQTIAYIKQHYPQHLVIADAKRGDIGNTAAMYAKTFFNTLNADAVTVAPYMGSDSVSPFLEYADKWTILLGLTSNKGAEDFQTEGQPPLYQKVISKASQWGSLNNLMFVVGATKAQLLNEIREVIPEHFLLVPGVGAQGGSLTEVAQHGMNKNCGLIVNASRSIIYASADIDFADKAAQEAKNIQQLMSRLLARCGQ